jgi:hypothetical protein
MNFHNRGDKVSIKALGEGFLLKTFADIVSRSLHVVPEVVVQRNHVYLTGFDKGNNLVGPEATDPPFGLFAGVVKKDFHLIAQYRLSPADRILTATASTVEEEGGREESITRSETLTVPAER